MSKNSTTDYLSCILFRVFGPLIRSFPLEAGLSLGKKIGELFYYFDFKHRAIAYSNLKKALGNQLSPSALNNLTKEFYRAFGQNVIEVLFTPLVNKEYINKYIKIEGLEHIREGFKKGKGVILLGVHEGSWELSNIICANLEFPFSLFIRNQRYPRLNRILNLYRSQKGCKIIQRHGQTRQLINALRGNEAIGMTADQGGKSGILVSFLGSEASMPSGAVRLALKYDAALIPAFYTRIKGPYVKVIIEPPFKIRKTGELEMDIRNNLQEIVHIFEKYIFNYPWEYLWSYKIWKYTKEKNVLILSDTKTGHLRQSQAVAKMVKDYFGHKGINTNIDTVEIKFKSGFHKSALALGSYFSGRYYCQGCLWCLRSFLKGDSYKSLVTPTPDMIISCGSSTAAINFVLSRENYAKSVVIMRPSILSVGKFDLVIMGRHDYPPKRKNVVITDGALNLIEEDYLREQSDKLMRSLAIECQPSNFCVGLLIGGDTKNFHLDSAQISGIIKQIKSVSERLGADILVTSSRRTPRELESLIKDEFKDYSRCALLVIANEINIPESIGGILALSKVIVLSPESISMISEAVNSRKYVLVFNALGLGKRHKRFLAHFAKNKYIYLTDPRDLGNKIEDIWLNKPPVYTPRDNLLVGEAIKNIL